MRSLEPFLIKQRSTNTKVHFVLHESYAGGSSTESLIHHLKSKHRIHVILESEDHKTIPEQKEIRSQIVKKEMSVFEATKKRSKNVKKKLFHALITIKAKSLEPQRAFSATGLFVTTQKQTEWWKRALIVMCQYYKHHWKTVPNLINNSLIHCAGTNSSSFTMILSFIAQNPIHFKTQKKKIFPGFFSQLPETQVLKFCPELEILPISMLNNIFQF